MAVANFQTSGTSGVSTNTGGGKNTFLMLIVVAGVAYLGYKYWYLPKQEKEKNDNQR